MMVLDRPESSPPPVPASYAGACSIQSALSTPRPHFAIRSHDPKAGMAGPVGLGCSRSMDRFPNPGLQDHHETSDL